MWPILRPLLVTFILASPARAEREDFSLFHPTPRELRRDLSTDRPDQTESPYTVDAGRWQLEMDFLSHTRDHDKEGGADVRLREWSLAPLNLKVGLTHRMDLQLMVEPHVWTRVEDRGAGTVSKSSGMGDLTTRLKVNIWGNDGGPTAFAVMPFVKWPLSASEVRNGETEGGVIMILGYELSGGWTSAIMTELDFVSAGRGGHDVEWLNSITFARDLTESVGFYVEFVAVTGDAPGFRWQGQVDGGITYALSEDAQMDFGCNIGVTRSAPDFQPFAGYSRRF